MLARTPQQFDLSEPQPVRHGALRDFLRGALCKEESTPGNGS